MRKLKLDENKESWESVEGLLVSLLVAFLTSFFLAAVGESVKVFFLSFVCLALAVLGTLGFADMAHKAMEKQGKSSDVRSNVMWVGFTAALCVIVAAFAFGPVRDGRPLEDVPSTVTDEDFDWDNSDENNIDCHAAVTHTMENLYGGGWGSGVWPDGEYAERVAQCEGE